MLVPGDYDGDGFTDLAVYRPSTLAYWYIDTNRDGAPNISVQFGTIGDIPVPGDYNGDGKMDLAVFRPSNGTWYISTNRDGIADITVQFGTSGDKPVQADYDGDGKADVAVFRPSTGYWYFKLSGDGSSPSVQWGASTDKLAPADYDADGKTDVAVFRPSDGRWYIIKSANGASISPQWGTSGDIPTPGAALSGLGLQRIEPLATVETDPSSVADPHPTAQSGPPTHRLSPLSPRSVVPEPQRRYFFYSPEMNLLAESELTAAATPAISYEYIWFNGHPVAQVDGGTTTHWTFTDHLGTPLIQTDSTATVYWRAEYEPYGRIFAYNPPGLADQHQPLRLPGQEAEQLNLGPNGVTERSYNIFRWYRSTWGRYTQADWLGLRDNVNLYQYAYDGPLTLSDPLGLSVLLRCRDVGTPGAFDARSAAAVFLFGAKHCFLEVTCPSQGIPPTLISYLGRGVTISSLDNPSNNDAAYSRLGNYDQVLVKPQGANGCCGFEKCLLRRAESLAGRKLKNYGLIQGATSNSVISRFLADCGGDVIAPPSNGAYGWDRPELRF